MVTTQTPNGTARRKQLSDQLDRLDAIIDALAEGLPGAVADAAREGTRLAVKDAVIEILTNPDLRQLLQGLPAVATPMSAAPPGDAAPQPGLWARLKAKAADAKARLTARFRTAQATVAGVSRTLSAIMPLRRIVLVAVGAGLATAAVAYAAPAAVAAVIGGVGGVVTAVAAQVAGWFRRSAVR